MDFVRNFSLRLNRLIESYEHGEKNEELSIGSLDGEVKKFIVSVIKGMIENYSDDEIYFGLVGVLGDLVYRLSDYETGYRVWVEFDINRVNEISSGTRESLEKLEGLKKYYSN